ncbi:MAG TPA: DUF1595 domain-containing protein, partial [Chthoniobacteraceae bacterium]|nr:DUF1595 domain-containing protein [Chthoniobacteraceae bacterium]
MTTAAVPRPRVYALALAAMIMTLVSGVAALPEAMDFEALQADAKKAFDEQAKPFLEAYCTKCHGSNKMKGGINFAPALKNPGSMAFSRQWKQALASVKSQDMPPDDVNKQPSDEERQKFVDWIAQIKFLSPKDPGQFVIRRLTKVEYGNTLRDLFGVDPAVAAALPDEVSGEGYLNSVSPLQSEQYLGIANEVVSRILAPDGAPPTDFQKRFFGEPPAPGADLRAAAQTVARKLAREAYRRPPSEAEADVLLGVFDLARANKLEYPAALRLMLKAVLVSPQFLFITPAAETEAGKTIVPLDDYQLASRLS